MRLAMLLGPDLEALTSDPEALKETFEEFHPEDVAELLEDLPASTVTGLVRALPPEMGADLVERLSPDRQEQVIMELRPTVAAGLLAELDPDDRVDLLQELEERDARKLLAQLATDEPEKHEETQELLAFEPESAGGLMTTEYVGLAPDMKLWEAVEEVRRLSRENEAETIHYVYVVGFGDKLLGVISLRDLILADPGQTLADVMSEKVMRVPPETDQEEVARRIARYDLTAMPVVDPQEGMLGVVTVDDVVDVVIEEATEDAQKQGGVVPLEDTYFSTGLVEFVWKRGIWLIVLFLGQLLTATVMEQNRETLLATVELALFIPLIIASGGNAGSQSSTLIIRAMAVGEAKPRAWTRVLARELFIGMALGVILGLMGFARGDFGGGGLDPLSFATAIGASILAIVTLSTMIGSLLPMLLRRVGLAPAVSSPPFIASVVDVLGLIVYFGVARAILAALV